MTRAWDEKRSYSLFVCMLLAQVSAANPGQCALGSHSCMSINNADEETALLQVHVHAASRSSDTNGAHVGNREADTSAPELGPKESDANRQLLNTAMNNAASELTESCTTADQAACSNAVSLASSLAKLTGPYISHHKSKEPIAAAAKVSFLREWFRNPGGTGGYFNFLDQDHNGEINATELTAHGAGGLMELIDLDKDAHISRKECQNFLRACAVLFKKLPTRDKILAHTTLPAMLNDADRVTLEKTAATSPLSNPLTQAASEIKEECPEPAEQKACHKAVDLANLLVKLTAKVPLNDVGQQAGEILGLWYWFGHPQGPGGMFSAADRHKQGSHTADELTALRQEFGLPENPHVAKLVKFADSNNDDKIDRAEAREYLTAAAMLIHKVPSIEPVSAFKPLSEVFAQAHSVLQEPS